MAQLAFHLLPQSTGGDWLSWAATGAPDVKVCDAALIYPAQQLGCRVFYRPCFLPADDGEGDCADGALWGQRVAEQIAANGHHWPEYIGYRNEMDPTAGNAAQYQRYRATLRAAGYTGPVVYGSFGNGRPDWPEYATIPPDVDAAEFHEYWSGTVTASPDLALRHVEAIRRGLIPATLPLILGEIGEWTAGHGWQRDVTAAQMVQQLAVYRAGCAPSVVAMFVFADGDNGDPQWQSFTTRGTAVEAAIRATWTPTPTPLKGSPVLAGIDISNVQGQVGWPSLRPEIAFVAIKASEGVGWPDPDFATNWQDARATGRVRIAYHFARPDLGNTPQSEAAYFLARLTDLQTGDLLAMDLEKGTGDLSGWALAWLQAVEAAVGFKPLLYSYPDFIATRNLGTAALAAYPLWYASYQGTEPAAPGRWASIAIWQDTDAAAGTGIPGTVDGDETGLTIDQLKALGKPAPQAQGAPVDEALAYYQQLGVKIAPDHAVYTEALKPMYAYWQLHRNDTVGGVPVGDLIKPGPAVTPEYGTLWGTNRPAACVKLQNCIAGAYQDEQGAWHGYRASI